MIKREFRNIAKFEKNKKRINESTLNDLLFDVFLKQIKMSLNFN